jgi:hypothetical protein
MLTVGMIGRIMMPLASMLAELNKVASIADGTHAVERCLMTPPKQRAAATAEV